VVSTAVDGVTTLLFALTSSYQLALAMLLIGGIANLASMSIGQTIVHWSLGLSSVALCLGTLAAGIYALRDRWTD